jgi:hypothetical protein
MLRIDADVNWPNSLNGKSFIINYSSSLCIRVGEIGRQE